ncbi:MAG: type IV pilus assembly protein PilM [Planctomycetota bacterium]|nr:type IV pilus assembly protein PilM [Planctomycetota bacterium]
MGIATLLTRKQSLIGLDFGISSIKLVELSKSGGELSLLSFDSVPAAQGIQGALEALLARSDFATRQVALAVGGRSVCVRYARFPEMPNAELIEAVKLEADRLLPFEDADITLDCQRLPRVKGESESEAVPVLVAGCRTEFVEERVEAVLAAGFTPTLVDVDLLGLVNAWNLDARPERASTVALVDVGGARTGIVLVNDGTPRFTREFEHGGGDSSVNSRREGDAPISVSGNSNEVDALAREIALSVEYAEHNEGLEVEEIQLTGGGALLEGLAERLAEEARRPVEIWDPMKAMAVRSKDGSSADLGDRGPLFTVALGLAARVLD